MTSQASVNATTSSRTLCLSKLGITLVDYNFIYWNERLHDNSTAYGNPGRQIRENRYILTDKPSLEQFLPGGSKCTLSPAMIEAMLEEPHRLALVPNADTNRSNSAGMTLLNPEAPPIDSDAETVPQAPTLTIRERQVAWDSCYRSYQAKMDKFEAAEEKDAKDHGLLWPLMMDSLGTLIKNKVVSDETFAETRRKVDTFALYERIRHFSHGLGKLSAQKIRTQWSDIVMGPRETFAHFIKRFNDKLEELENAGEIVSNGAKTFQLSQSIERFRFESQPDLSKVYSATDIDAPDYPEYKHLCLKLQAYEDNRGGIPAGGADDSLPLLDRNGIAESDNGAVKAFYSDHTKGPNNGNHRGANKPPFKSHSQQKHNGGSNQRQAPPRQFVQKPYSGSEPRDHGSHCTNCQKDGHKSIHCTQESVICDHCKNPGHTSKDCRNLARLLKGNNTGAQYRDADQGAKRKVDPDKLLPNRNQQQIKKPKAYLTAVTRSLGTVPTNDSHDTVFKPADIALLTRQQDPVADLAPGLFKAWATEYFRYFRPGFDIVRDFCPLHEIDSSMRSIPRAHMAEFWRACTTENADSAPAHPTDEELSMNYIQEANIAPDGKSRVPLPIFHPEDVLQGIAYRPRYLFPSPATAEEIAEMEFDEEEDTEIGSLSLTDKYPIKAFMARPNHHYRRQLPSECPLPSDSTTRQPAHIPLVTIDSACPIHVLTDTELTAGRHMVNRDRHVVVTGISGAAPLRVTHTGHRPGFGSFYICPDANANLISVLTLSQEGMTIGFGEQGATVTNAQGVSLRVRPNDTDGHYTLSRERFSTLLPPPPTAAYGTRCHNPERAHRLFGWTRRTPIRRDYSAIPPRNATPPDETPPPQYVNFSTGVNSGPQPEIILRQPPALNASSAPVNHRHPVAAPETAQFTPGHTRSQSNTQTPQRVQNTHPLGRSHRGKAVTPQPLRLTPTATRHNRQQRLQAAKDAALLELISKPMTRSMARALLVLRGR